MADFEIEKLKYGKERDNAMNDYFKARPGFYKNADTIKIFEDGFERGFNLGVSKNVKSDQ